MKSAKQISKRIAEAKEELQAITNPWVPPKGKLPGYAPPVESNDAKKAENEKKVIALTAEINALSSVLATKEETEKE